MEKIYINGTKNYTGEEKHHQEKALSIGTMKWKCILMNKRINEMNLRKGQVGENIGWAAVPQSPQIYCGIWSTGLWKFKVPEKIIHSMLFLYMRTSGPERWMTCPEPHSNEGSSPLCYTDATWIKQSHASTYSELQFSNWNYTSGGADRHETGLDEPAQESPCREHALWSQRNLGSNPDFTTQQLWPCKSLYLSEPHSSHQ